LTEKKIERKPLPRDEPAKEKGEKTEGKITTKVEGNVKVTSAHRRGG